MAKATICDRDKRIAPEKPYKLSISLVAPDGSIMAEVRDAELCEPCALGFVTTFETRIKIDASDPEVFVSTNASKPSPTPKAAAPEAPKPTEKRPE